MSRAVFLASLPVMAMMVMAGKPPVVSLSRVPEGGIQPQVVEGMDGRIHMLYFQGDPKGGDLYYVQAGPPGEFSKPVRVNSQPGSAIAMGTIRGGQIAIGRNGRVHVAWNGSNSALPQGMVNPESGKPGSPMLYARMNDEGTAFEPQRNLMTRTFGLDGGGTLAADAEGNVYVAWHGKERNAEKGEAGRRVWVAESHDGGKTFRPEIAAWKEPTGACGCCGMSMFSTHEGKLLALYRSATREIHRDIYLLASEDDGKSFHGSLVQRWEINACPMSSMSFAESRGAAVAAWETGGQVYYGEVKEDRVARPVAAPGEGKGRKHPRVARNAKGETLLVWTEGTGWKRGGSLAWQLFDRDGNAIGEKGSVAGVPVWSFGSAAARADGTFAIYY